MLVGATLYREERCFPACMIAPSVDCVSFVFLYEMRMFGLLAALLWAGVGPELLD